MDRGREARSSSPFAVIFAVITLFACIVIFGAASGRYLAGYPHKSETVPAAAPAPAAPAPATPAPAAVPAPKP